MSIKKILSISQLRQLKLIDFIINEGPSTQKTLITKLSYSEPTLYRDITVLNQIIAPVKIHTNNKIKLIIPPTLNIRYIYSSLLTASTEFNLIEEIFFCETHSFESLSEKLFTSSSTIRRIIKRINTIMRPYEIQISSYPLKIIGSEKQISLFMELLFSEKYSHASNPFSDAQIEFLDQIKIYLTLNQNINLSYRKLKHLQTLILIIIIRIRNGNITHTPITAIPNIYRIFFENKKNIHLFEKAFSFTMTDEHIHHLLNLIYSTGLAINKKHLAHLANGSKKIEKKVVIFKLLIENISQRYGIKLENEENLIHSIYNTSVFYLDFPPIFYDINKEFIDGMMLSNEKFILYLKKELASLDYFNDWNDSSVYAIAYTLITHWKNFLFYLKKKAPIAKVGVFFDSDIDHMSFVISELKTYFNHTMDFEIVSYASLTAIDSSPILFDFLLTNIPNILDDSTSYICISMYPNAYDIEKIKKKYLSLTY